MPKPEIIKALLKAGADVNAKLGEEWSEKDTSALYRAVEGESLECVELIVAAGADLCGNQNVTACAPPRYRRDTCSMAWRCWFLTARRSQRGRIIAEK